MSAGIDDSMDVEAETQGVDASTHATTTTTMNTSSKEVERKKRKSTDVVTESDATPARHVGTREFWASMEPDHPLIDIKKAALEAPDDDSRADAIHSASLVAQESHQQFKSELKEILRMGLRDVGRVILQANKPLTIQDVLEEHCKTKNAKIPHLVFLAVNEGKRSYFLAHEVHFRHEGVIGQAPKSVYMKVDSVGEKKDDAVKVFMSASGSGKTVELAGSAFRRRAHLALVWTRDEDDKDLEEWEDKDKRNKEALTKISEIVESTFAKEHVKNLLQEMLTLTGGEKVPLRLVVGLDEMSGMPIFTRALIANRHEAGETVARTLLGRDVHPNEISVVFSVAGTGASRGSIGSLPENWDLQTTSATADPEEAFNALKKEYTTPSLEVWKSWEDLEKRHCVLHTMMTHNARMLSIAVARLSQVKSEHLGVEGENSVIENIFAKFVESNGLKGLKDDTNAQVMVGAQALAVHLFQEPVEVPRDSAAREKLAGELNYGITFSDEYRKMSSIERLVQRYGLLIPRDFPEVGDETTILERPFEVDDAMQLVSLYLMQTPLNQKRSLLEASPFGFEVFSTQLVKCAVAASQVVASEKRLTIGQILSDKLGFFYPDSWSEKSKCGDDARNTKRMWEELSTVKAARVAYGENEGNCADTLLHEVEAELIDANSVTKMSTAAIFVTPEGEMTAYVAEEHQSTAKGALVFDMKAMSRVVGMKESSRAPKQQLRPPLASVAYGNSSLADGYVTFMAADAVGSVKKYTIMIQAKDYFGTSTLRLADLNDHAKKCYDKRLDVGFGSNRLLCVASKKNKLGGDNVRTGRNFAGFRVDASKILSGMMEFLDERRSFDGRLKQSGGVYLH